MPSLFKPTQEPGQDFNAMFKDVPPVNLVSSLSSRVKQGAQNIASSYSLAGKVAQETVKAPLKLAGAIAEAPYMAAQAYRGEPFQPLPRVNIPGLGEFATPARNTYDESMQTNDPMQLASSGIYNASAGLLDLAGTVSLASLAKTAMQKGGVNIFRGETAANKGGVHWALDKADAKPFGTVSNRTIHPSEIVDESNPEVQRIVKEGADNLLEFPEILKNLWAKGYNAISNVDAMTGKKGIILNPAFTSKAEFAKDALMGATIPGSTPLIEAVQEGVTKATGNEGAGMAAGMLAGFALPGGKKITAKARMIEELEAKIVEIRSRGMPAVREQKAVAAIRELLERLK